MSGGGPDAFIMSNNYGDENEQKSSLFKYPQKSMEMGLFLSLDEYMENNTQFTEWDKLT